MVLISAQVAYVDHWSVNKVKAYIHKVPEAYWHWWFENSVTMILTAQTSSIFLGIEEAKIPAPFSWLVRLFDVVSLRALAAFFYSPCARPASFTIICRILVVAFISESTRSNGMVRLKPRARSHLGSRAELLLTARPSIMDASAGATFMTHYTAIVLTTLFPLLIACALALVAVPVYVRGAGRGRAAWWVAMNRCGLGYFATFMLLFHMSICVQTFQHFNCHGLCGNLKPPRLSQSIRLILGRGSASFTQATARSRTTPPRATGASPRTTPSRATAASTSASPATRA